MKQINYLLIAIFMILVLLGSVNALNNLSTDLVGYWNLDDIGNTYIDSTGKFNLSASGNATVVSGKVGNAKNFTGDSNYGYITNSVKGNPENLTSCMWTYSYSGGDGYNTIFSYGDVVSVFGHIIATTSGGGDGYLHFLSSKYPYSLVVWAFSMNTSYPINQWNYVCVSSNLTYGVKVYFNGENVYNHTLESTDTGIVNTDIYIGVVNSIYGHSAYAIIDEVGFWNKTLSDNDIYNLYNITSNNISYPFETVYTNPTSANLLNDSCNISFTKDISNTYYSNISLNWSIGLSNNLNANPIMYNLTQTILNLELCYTTNTSCQLTTNNFSSGIIPIYLETCDLYNCSFSTQDCNINICSNNWIQAVQPCNSGTKLILFNDIANCSIKYNIPVTNGTYQDCSNIVYNQQVYQEDFIILGILFLFLLVSVICGIFVHEGFFGLCGILVGLMILVFQQYNYPNILKYVSIIMVLIFIGMWILIHKIKR